MCGRVAEALLGQFTVRNGQPPPDKLATAFRDLVVERCTQDVWSPQATDCMVAPNADLDACTAILTPQQQQTFQDDARKKLAAAAVEADAEAEAAKP